MKGKKRFKLRNYFIGKDIYIESWTLYKRVMLTSQFSLIALFVAIFYFLFDFFHGSMSGLWVYLGLGFTSILSLINNRIGLYTLARLILLFGANLTVFVLYEMELPGTGSYLFFIICIIGSFTLFGYKERLKGYISSAFALALFLAGFYNEFDFIPKTDFPVEDVANNFLVNFIIASITSIFIISFLLRINRKSEDNLRKNEKSLRALTEELTQSKNRFELAIHGNSAGIWDWDILNDSIYISPLLAEMLDYRYGDTINQAYKQVFEATIHRDDQKLFAQKMRSHLKNRTPFKVEVRMMKTRGEYIWVLDTGQAEWDENGNPVRMVGSIIDITERKRAAEKINEQNKMLEKTNAELDRFVYSTSHDLKAPLSSILGLIRIFELTDDDEEKKNCLNMMRERIDTLNGFIADIIDYSRNSRLSVEKDSINLNQLVSDAILNLQYFEHSQEIRIVKENLDLEFLADRSRLKIIVNNILANAIKYHDIIKDDPYVIIKGEMIDDQIVITIADNGRGIKEDLQQDIFNMFFRASEDSEGSGLGLYIAKEMADKLDGSISVHSTMGEGTAFTISIPKI
ncbi:sensor histidine kinase [Fulvivirga ligni]|uniref:sensor histidine kinase n=1 Tax=Fulvivirga ligni TaxID=2904246 RepID=UPI001F33332B|nr:PAS domain-containing sensor histidine kinase [Fulvivirga ligni]UII22015.1 PAS domain-containing sensor histidine kinase [Fulvivirga ligni]